MPHFARPARPPRAALLALAVAALVAFHRPDAALASTGVAAITPSASVPAGAPGTWTLTYTATADFARPQGGTIRIQIPPGWTAPQVTDSLGAGYVKPESFVFVDSLSVSGQALMVHLGAPPKSAFKAGDSISLFYGAGGGPAAAFAQTLAPASATFAMDSDTCDCGSFAPVLIQKYLSVVPDTVAHVRIVDAVGVPVGARSLTADEDTTHLFLQGYDRFDNTARPVTGAWSVLGGIGAVSPITGTGTVFSPGAAGTGFVFADSGAWSDSTGLFTVSHGAYAGLRIAAAPAATAGVPFAASVTAVDADGNQVVSGPGSGEAVVFRAYADSTGATPADPSLASGVATLVGGAWSGTASAYRSGAFYLAARDTVTGIESVPRAMVSVSGAPPDSMTVAPDTLRLEAGDADTLVVRFWDEYGNRTAASSDLAFTLWTDRPAGHFESLAGAPIFELVVPAGADSAALRFVDLQVTSSPGRVRVIDADGSAPSLGTAGAWVLTAPGAPSGAVALAPSPDSLVADGADSSWVVSGVVRDAYGNAVAAGERFTLSGSLVVPATDQDAGAPGAQLLASASGTLSSWVRAGTLKGAGSVSVVSERGNAAGSAPLALLAGAPSGALLLVTAPDSLAADSASTLSVSASGLADVHGNQVEDGERFTVATTLGTIASPDLDPGTPGVQVAASGGAISFALFGGDSLGTASITAASVRGTAGGSVPVRLVPGSISAPRSSVSAASPVSVGPAGSTATITLRDSQDHPIPGVPADSVAVSASGLAATVAPLGAQTDGSGALAYRVASTATGTATVSATARGVALAPTADVTFQPGPLDHYVISGPTGTLASGAPQSLVVEARDAYGNAMPARSGDTLHSTATTGGATLPASVTLAAGAATVPFTPTLAAPLTIQVADDSSRAVSYGPVAVSPGPAYRVVAVPVVPATLAAGDSVAVRALLLDADGNAVASGVVDAAVVAGGGSVAPSSDATDASGYVDFVLRAGAAPGLLALRLVASASSAPDSVRADSVLVSVVPAAATAVEVSAAAGAMAAGDSLAVTLTLRDRFGNVASGSTPSVWLRTTTPVPTPDHVAWSPAGAAGALSDSASSDGASYQFAAGDAGIATLRLHDTRAETIRARASGAGLPVAESADIAVGPAGPSTLAIVSGDGQTGVVGRDLPLPLRVQARDAFGNTAPGAVVSFRVTVGNGSVDAVAGGAPDSLATADGAGVATCDVARLGSAAGPATNAFRATLAAAPAATVTFTAGAVADTAASLSLSPASLALPAGGAATVTVTARDRFGNPAPGAAVTFYLGSPALGALESLGGTSGGPGSQSGTTGASGTLDVRYRAPGTAPASDSIYARGVSIGPVAITATVTPAATASLRVLPDSLGWVAGSPVRVRVQALDPFGNPATADTATVVMRTGGAVTWSPAFGPMVAGEFVTFGRDTVAESVVIGADRVGGGAGSGGTAAVRPADPSGVIPIAATRDTLTADGRSTATVTLGPVRDAFGNLESAGTLVLVSAQAGALIAPDASPLPGLDLALDASARATAVLTAPAAAGPDTIRAASRLGAASGSLPVAYVPAPSLTYAPGSLAPTIVVPGSAYAFRLALTNSGTGTLQLATGSTLSFGAAPSAFAASLAAPLALGPGATDTLRFTASGVPAGLVPGTYAPSLRAVGADGTGEAFDFYPSLAGAQVFVAGVDVAASSATPSPVPLGYTGLTLVFDVHNPTGTAASLDAASLATSAGSFAINGFAPVLPALLPAGGSVTLQVSVTVPTSGIPSGATVDAWLTATARFGTSSVVGTNAASLSFVVVSAARVVAIAGGATPGRYLRARTFAPAARVANTGSAGLALSRGATQLLLAHPGGDRLVAGLSAVAAVAGGDTATLAFDSLAVPAAVARGRYAASLVLAGTESGQAFADTIPLDPDSVSVLDPPILSVTSTVSPATVSAGQSRPLSVTLSNSGDVPMDLDPGTALSIGPPVSTTLTLGAAPVLGPGASIGLLFTGSPLGSPLAPGSGAATLEVRGREDGRYREQSIGAGALDAQAPASLAFVAGSTSPSTVRAGEVYDVTVAVRNEGGSPFLLDPAASRLSLTDGVEAVTALGAGAAQVVPSGGQATLYFPAADFPASLASQAYPVSLVLYGSEWSWPESTTVPSPAGEIMVREPAAAVQVRGFDVPGPIQVAPGSTALSIWGLEVTPLLPPGGVTTAQLTSVRLTALVDGTRASSPGTTLASIALRDPAGALLAQAAPAGANPVALTLPAPLSVSSGADTLYVEVAVQGGASARSIALQLAGATDLVVLDDLTSTPVPVTAGGGLPFAPIASRTLTLYTAPHGYPNPFRAGGESVRLSYVLAEDASVTVTIYTLLGDKVREITAAAGAPGGSRGLNELPWDGRNGNGNLVVPGVYVAALQGGGLHEQIKVGVVR